MNPILLQVVGTNSRLKDRLWSVYSSGGIIPLPFLSAAHAAPLALLDHPGSSQVQEQGVKYANLCSMQILNPIEQR